METASCAQSAYDRLKCRTMGVHCRRLAGQRDATVKWSDIDTYSQQTSADFRLMTFKDNVHQ